VLRDARQTFTVTGIIRARQKGARKSSLMATVHILEKGLALRDWRFCFGEQKIQRLMALLRESTDSCGSENNSVNQAAVEVLHAYLQAHYDRFPEAKNNPWLQEVDGFVQELQESTGETVSQRQHGGVKKVTKSEIQKSAVGSFPDLVRSRSSIRHFGDGDLRQEDLIRCVELAQRSPSSCNRQPSRVYVVRDRERIASILENQRGARGFDKSISALLIIAADMRTVLTVNERHQPWFDAGLFAMTLMYALHHCGYGSCPLHWCVDKRTDQMLRKTVPIKQHHIVMVLIGVGTLPGEFAVPISHRLSVESVLEEV